jgi:hypothetical protein
VTSQTKHYIETQDILSIRCDCKECGASLSLPLAYNPASSLLACPKCRKPWLRYEGGTYEITLNEFVKRIEELKLLLPHTGFNLYFEIASDPASAEKD